MNAIIADGYIRVTLSKRNLLSLLHKLEMQGSHRTIVRELGGGVRISVSVESDEEHYGARDIPAGAMHPETEAFIKAHEVK